MVALLAVYHPQRAAFACCLILAFLSDVFDGILARRLKVATANLRRLDSLADSIFYAAALFAAWHLYSAAIRTHLPGLAVLAALELARYALDWLKFGREASYHMWSSKLWGVFLFAGFYSLLALGSAGPVVAIAIYTGIAADVEGIAISLLLPEWRHDVPSFVHAWRLRYAAFAERAVQRANDR